MLSIKMLIIFTLQHSQVNTASVCVFVCESERELEMEREREEDRGNRYGVRAVHVNKEILKN